MRNKVDPAALLVAVLAVGVNPLFEAGAWDRINLITAAIVLVVLICFTWPRTPASGEEPPGYAVVLAQSVVYGFIVAVGSAWLFQLPIDQGEQWRIDHCLNRHSGVDDGVERLWLRNGCELDLEDDMAETATSRALLAGAGTVLVSLMVIGRRVQSMRRRAAETALPIPITQASPLLFEQASFAVHLDRPRRWRRRDVRMLVQLTQKSESRSAE